MRSWGAHCTTGRYLVACTGCLVYGCVMTEQELHTLQDSDETLVRSVNDQIAHHVVALGKLRRERRELIARLSLKYRSPTELSRIANVSVTTVQNVVGPRGPRTDET